MKLTTKPYSKYVDKKLEDLEVHLKETGANVAGQKELDYILANPSEFPELKSGDYFFFGAKFRNADGNWHVPYVCGPAWRRDGDWLGNDWDSGYRVVLLCDSSPLTPDHLKLGTLDTPVVTEIEYLGKKWIPKL